MNKDEQTNISNETDLIKKNSELRLLEAIKTVLTNGLKVLGIVILKKRNRIFIQPPSILRTDINSQ